MKEETVRWWKAAGVRAIKTACQTSLALIGTNSIGVTDVDWIGVLSGAALAAIYSVLTSIAGLPELNTGVANEDTEEKKQSV